MQANSSTSLLMQAEHDAFQILIAADILRRHGCDTLAEDVEREACRIDVAAAADAALWEAADERAREGATVWDIEALTDPDDSVPPYP